MSKKASVDFIAYRLMHVKDFITISNSFTKLLGWRGNKRTSVLAWEFQFILKSMNSFVWTLITEKTHSHCKCA